MSAVTAIDTADRIPPREGAMLVGTRSPMQATAPMSSPCTTGYRAACPPDNEAGWRSSLAKLAALVESG